MKHSDSENDTTNEKEFVGNFKKVVFNGILREQNDLQWIDADKGNVYENSNNNWNNGTAPEKKGSITVNNVKEIN